MFLCYACGNVVEVGVVYSCVGISVRKVQWSICVVISENPLMLIRQNTFCFHGGIYLLSTRRVVV